MGKEYRLVNESNTGRVIDTLIGLYESVENMRSLNVDGLRYEIKEIIKMKKSAEKKKPRGTVDKSITEETPDDFIDGNYWRDIDV
jgi:phosphatidylserine decarboxylase